MIFSELDTRKMASIPLNSAITKPATTGGQFHRVTATRYNRIVVTNMVPDTAMP